MYQHLSFQDPQKVSQIRIFGKKIFHLATLLTTLLRKSEFPRNFQGKKFNLLSAMKI
jgi:hypothetical protein